jgi:hypothetical protein
MTTKLISHRLRASAAIGTWLQGYYETTYEELEAAFGQPHWSEDIVTCQWVLSLQGQIVTIYARDDGPTSPTTPYQWHVGGTSYRSMKALEWAIEFGGLAGHAYLKT